MATSRRKPDQDRARRLPPDREQNANERLLDDAIERAHLIERLKAHEVRAVNLELEDRVWDPLLARVAGGLVASRGRGARLGGGRDPLKLKAYRDLTEANTASIRRGFREARKALSDRLGELAEAEAEWQVAAMQEAVSVGGGLAVTFKAPAPVTLRAVAEGSIVRGQHLRKWFDALGTTAAQRVEREIAVGLVGGEGIETIVRRLKGRRSNNYTDGVIEASRRELRTVVRTAVNQVSSDARESTYAANRDLITGVQWVSTLDARTCPQCGSLDGQTFPVGEGIRPPAHHQCRCTAVPQLKSWREMGFDFDEVPESTRASVDGQVAESLHYPEWLRRQSAARQREALGPERYRLYRDGLTIDRFVDRQASSRPLTVAQIRQRNPVAAR